MVFHYGIPAHNKGFVNTKPQRIQMPHETKKSEDRIKNKAKASSMNLFIHCTPRALPQDDYVILQGASPKGAAISLQQPVKCTSFEREIASVVSLPRNDIINHLREM
jgi:hypothetical protein